MKRAGFSKERILYPLLLFNQMERCNQAMGVNVYEISVRNLIVLLRPFVDDKFKGDVRELKDRYHKYDTSEKRSGSDVVLDSTKFFEYHQDLYALCIDLCDRAGLIKEMLRTGVEI